MRKYLICCGLLFWTCSVFATQSDLSNIYESREKQYSIHYPASWQVHDHGKGMVVFIGKVGKLPLSVNIQTIFTKKAHGEYPTIKALMDDFWYDVPKHTDQVKFLERRPILLVEPDGAKLSGEQATLTFKERGVTFKQWQIIVMSRDGVLFQAWAYRAPLKDFDTNRPLAEDILASWEIY